MRIHYPRILYVDCDMDSTDFVRTWLAHNAPGCHTTCLTSGGEAAGEIARAGFDIYLFEYCLGDMTGPELCRKVRAANLEANVLICTSLARNVDREMAMAAEATDYIVKPDDLYRLAAILKETLGPLPPFQNRSFHTVRRSAAII